MKEETSVDRLARVIGQLMIATAMMEFEYHLETAMCQHDGDIISDFLGPQMAATRHNRIREIIEKEFESFQSFNNALDTEFPKEVASMFKSDQW
jgi:hypothetical protein